VDDTTNLVIEQSNKFKSEFDGETSNEEGQVQQQTSASSVMEARTSSVTGREVTTQSDSAIELG